MATYEINAQLNLKPLIDETREVIQALSEFADSLERIDGKYAEHAPEVTSTMYTGQFSYAGKHDQGEV